MRTIKLTPGDVANCQVALSNHVCQLKKLGKRFNLNDPYLIELVGQIYNRIKTYHKLKKAYSGELKTN